MPTNNIKLGLTLALTLLMVIFKVRSQMSQPNHVIKEELITLDTPNGKLLGRRIQYDYDLGLDVDTVNTFLGVPFAEPPVGIDRFQSPRPIKPWTFRRDATVFGKVCPQYTYYKATRPEAQSEDCLYLNVYSPYKNAKDYVSDDDSYDSYDDDDDDYAVMVYIHGGSYEEGSGILYDGSLLAMHGVVVVTINYRLGELGHENVLLTGPGPPLPRIILILNFIIHTQGFLTSGDDRLPGNFGLEDQIEALRWVKKNIGAFGGNPGRVTLVGNSAGAASIGLLMTSPQAQGLFHGAILQSGSPLSFWSHYDSSLLYMNHEEFFRHVAGRVGCPPNRPSNRPPSSWPPSSATASNSPPSVETLVVCLKNVTPTTFIDEHWKMDPLVPSFFNFRPRIDGGPLLPLAPAQAFQGGHYHHVPVLLGVVEDEWARSLSWFLMDLDDSKIDDTDFEDGLTRMTFKEAVHHVITKRFRWPAEVAEAAILEYTQWRDMEDPYVNRVMFKEFMSDLTIMSSTLRLSDFLSSSSSSSSFSAETFDVITNNNKLEILGPCKSIDCQEKSPQLGGSTSNVYLYKYNYLPGRMALNQQKYNVSSSSENEIHHRSARSADKEATSEEWVVEDEGHVIKQENKRKEASQNRVRKVRHSHKKKNQRESGLDQVENEREIKHKTNKNDSQIRRRKNRKETNIETGGDMNLYKVETVEDRDDSNNKDNVKNEVKMAALVDDSVYRYSEKNQRNNEMESQTNEMGEEMVDLIDNKSENKEIKPTVNSQDNLGDKHTTTDTQKDTETYKEGAWWGVYHTMELDIVFGYPFTGRQIVEAYQPESVIDESAKNNAESAINNDESLVNEDDLSHFDSEPENFESSMSQNEAVLSKNDELAKDEEGGKVFEDIWTEEDRQMSKRVMKLWTNFIKYGNPTPKSGDKVKDKGSSTSRNKMLNENQKKRKTVSVSTSEGSRNRGETIKGGKNLEISINSKSSENYFNNPIWLPTRPVQSDYLYISRDNITMQRNLRTRQMLFWNQLVPRLLALSNKSHINKNEPIMQKAPQLASSDNQSELRYRGANRSLGVLSIGLAVICAVLLGISCMLACKYSNLKTKYAKGMYVEKLTRHV